MDPILGNHLYTSALRVLLDKEADITLRGLIKDKIEEMPLEEIMRGSRLEESNLEIEGLKVTLGGVDSIEKHKAVALASRVFNIASQEAKDLEHKVFHIDPPLPPSLVPVEGPVTDKYTLIQHSARSPLDVINIAKVFNIKSIRTLISVRPERAVMHHICRRFF